MPSVRRRVAEMDRNLPIQRLRTMESKLADTHRQADTVVPYQTRIERPHGLQHAQASTHGTLGIVLMRLGIAKVDEQAIAQ